MPCGNASLKRWAKGRAEPSRHAELGPSKLPLHPPHGRLEVMARGEGQVALLVKGDHHAAAAGNVGTGGGTGGGGGGEWW